MILYLDTSALVKRYFQEAFTEKVVAKWKDAQAIATSAVAYAETLSAIYRKKREANLDEDTLLGLINTFQSDWNGLVRIQVTDELNKYINLALQNHPLRGFDAVHLASALVILEQFPDDVFFACFDERLNTAARDVGLGTV